MANPTTPDPQDRIAPESSAASPILYESSTEMSQAGRTYVPGAVTGPAIPRPLKPLPAALGRYQVLNVLGEGGFGAVYLGHDTKLDRPVAIKVFRGGTEETTAEADRLLREARRLAKLRHPGIVAVHDVGTQDGQIFVVSEYLAGQDLAHWLKRTTPSWQHAVKLVIAVADALAYAHSQLMVHRDVKPANIILTSAGDPVLVDFGLALDDASAGGGELGIVSGTPAYMAPEQVTGIAHRIDGRTDIYSLGVVLYEMLCGCIPFRAEQYPELLRQVRDDEPQPLRQIAREIPPELERICLKALAKKCPGPIYNRGRFRRRLATRRPADSGIRAPRSSFRQSEAGDRSRCPRLTAKFFAARCFAARGSMRSSSLRRVRDAERRQVTVLLCSSDVFESDAYLDNLDAEDQANVLQMFQQVCEQAVREFEGTVVQCNEQGFLACFGYPVAYEDAARRAAKSGLRLLDQLKELAEKLRRQHRLELNPFVALHTGQAVVETKDQTVSLVGEARNVALRLKNLAVPGQLICTEDTHRLFRGRFQCASLGQQNIKGAAGSVELFRVDGIATRASLMDTPSPTELSPLTGRDHEMSLLKDRWEQAQEGMGQIVLLFGEPGLGKSRLVDTLKEYVQVGGTEGAADPPVIEWRCSSYFQNTGLYPAINFFERTLDFRREDSPATRFDRLLERLEQDDMARPEVVPLWASLLSLPATDRFPPLSLSPARQREETFRALIEWLQNCAAQRPILFIVEDLHWVDASTVEFLGQLIAEGMHDRILTVLTSRPEFKPPWPAVAHQTNLPLNRLTRRQAGDLMRKKSGGACQRRSSSRCTIARGACRCLSKNSPRWCRSLARRAEPGSRTRRSSPRTRSPPRCRI